MKYITPEGKEAQGEAAVYLDAVGSVDGDTVKGSALEVPQREIINTIKDAGLTPDEADLHQLSKAVDAKIASKLTVATGTAPGMVKPDGTTTIVNASGVISAVQNPTPVATGSKAGVVKPDGVTTIVDVNGTISTVIPEPAVASTATAGIVKVDGSTISINNGTISAAKEPIATTSVPGLVKPDGITIIAGSDGTLVATTPAIDIATTSKTGTVKPDGTSITVTGDGTISAKPQTIPVASTTVSGTVKVDGTTVTIAGGVISAAPAVSKATATTLGTVKPDGSTITVDTNGTISAVAQAATMTKATASAIGAVKPDGTTITVDSNGVLKATAQPVSLATSTTPGTVQPDNSTITINGSGIISAALPNKATNSTLGVVKPDGVSTIITADGSIKSVFGGNGGDPNTPPTTIDITTNGIWTPPNNGWAKISLRAPGGGGVGGNGRLTGAFGGAGGGQGELVEFYQYLNTTDIITIDLGTTGKGSNANIGSTDSAPAVTPGTDATNATITINGSTTTAMGGKGAISNGNPGLGGGTDIGRGETGSVGVTNNVNSSIGIVAVGGKGGGSDTGRTKYDATSSSYIQLDATGYGSGGCGGTGTSTLSSAVATRGSNGGPGICTFEYLAINASSSVTGFGVTKSAAQVIPANTSANVKVTFDTVESNYKNQYDLTSNKFIPSPGRWVVNIGLEIFPLTASCDYYAMLYKNGVQFKYAITQTKMGTNMTTVNLSTIIDANGTDYFEVYVAGTDVNGAYSTATYSVKNGIGTFFNAIQIQSPAGGSVATIDTPGVVKPDGVSTVVTADGTLKSVFSSAGGDPNVIPSKTYITTNGTWTPPHNGWAKISLRAPGGGGCGGTGRVTAAFGGAGGGQGELIEIYQYLNTTDVINIALGTAGNGSNAAISSTETVPTMTPGGDATNATITINGTTTTAIGGKGASSHMNPGIGGGTSATRGESGLNGEKNNISTSYVAAASGGKGGGSDTGYTVYKSNTNTYIQIDATGYGAGGCGGVGFSTAGTAYATRGSNGGPGVCVVEYLAINGNAYKGFSAGKSVAQSIPGNTASYTKLTFDTIDWNPGSVYDPATGKFTPPPGKWSIAASIQVSGLTASSIYQLRLYKNGVVHRTAVQQTAITSNILIVPMSTVIDANGTDYFELYIYSNATAAYSVTVSTGTYFQAVPVQSTSLAATEAMVTAAQAASVSAVAAATSAAHLGAPSNTRYVDISFTGNLNGSTSMTYTALTDGFLNIAVTAGSATDWIRVDYGVSTITANASSIGQLISVYVPVQKDTVVAINIKGGTITKCRFVYAEGAA